MTRAGFVTRMKQRQIRWAVDRGLSPAETEGGISRDHVLLHESREKNLYDPGWWDLIRGKEHRWARALTSSQCFAVNLFAPLVHDPELARRVFERLFPGRLEAGSSVEVCLEYAPPETGVWLGEAGQTTQVDACFVISKDRRPVAYMLIEVKLAETGLGTCRGAKGPEMVGKGNPDSDRCEDFGKLRSSPETLCWMATDHRRKYWDWLADTDWFDLEHIPDSDGCPFRDGLDQLMRNAVLARALMVDGGAAWAEVAVCVHPGNDSAHRLGYALWRVSRFHSYGESSLVGYRNRACIAGSCEGTVR